MKINHVSLSQAKNELMLSGIQGPQIINIELKRLKSYRLWANKLASALYQHKSNTGLADSAIQYMLGLLNENGNMYYIIGKADIYIYHWDSGEPKVIPIWKPGFLLQEEVYWLNFYPFISKCKDKHEYQIDERKFKMYKLPYSEDRGYYLSTHNNHFGHFLLDNLAGLTLLKGPLSEISGDRLFGPIYPSKGGIDELLKWCFESHKNILPLHATCDKSLNLSNVCYKDVDFIEIAQSSLLSSAFLWEISSYAKLANSVKVKGNHYSYEKTSNVALIRGGIYESRIYNKIEIITYLQDLKFDIVDPSELAIDDLVARLRRSKVVLAESGSTTLTALFFSSKECKIISLNPARLLLEPDESMIRGGLPYLLAFSHRINFVLGETIVRKPIQSSDIAQYSTCDIKKCLLALNNKDL